MRPGIDAVAFDLDGTLYPNYSLNIRCIPFGATHLRLFIAFAKARGVFHQYNPEQNKAGKTAQRGDYYAAQAAAIASILGEEPDAVRAKIEKLIYRGWEPHFRKIKLFGGAAQVLKAFKAAGLKLGLLSDFPPVNKIRNLGIDSYWDAMLSTEEAGALKPDPLSFFDLARVLKTEPGRILFVGNSYKYDVIGAKYAGMQTALLTRSRLSTGSPPSAKSVKIHGEPDFVFHDYRQLLNYVLH